MNTPRPLDGERPLVFAHRGGAGLFPENTVHAFRECLSGYDVTGIELDVRLTSDSKVVVMHDPTVDRTTDGRGQVSQMTLTQLRNLDAGYRFMGKDGGHPFRGKGITVPTLEEALDTLSGTHMMLEVKKDQPDPTACAGRVMRILKKSHRERTGKLSFLGSFSYDISRNIRERAGIGRKNGPEHVLGYLSELESAREKFLGWRKGTRDALQGVWMVPIPPKHMLVPLDGRSFIDRAHEHGYRMVYWTIDTRDQMERLLERGADGIITNRPDIALELTSV